MAEPQGGNILRRKLAAARAPEPEGGPGADRSWRVALARAARDCAKLALDVQGLSIRRLALAEVLEALPERALIAVLQGQGEALGVLVLTPEVLASLVESLTIGRVGTAAPPPRRPTRTDAAMCTGFIDAALAGLEAALQDEADLSWAGGYRYGSHMEDARPLGLLLEDADYKVLTADVSLALGQRTGRILMALPAEGARLGEEPVKVPEGPPPHAFADALAERLETANVVLQAILGRVRISIGEAAELAEGVILPLPNAGIDRITLEGLDGRILGEGRLGQNRGMRAIRLSERAAAPAARPAAMTQSQAPGSPLPVRAEGGAEAVRAAG